MPGQWAEAITAIAEGAGALIMRYYQASPAVRVKADHSPVTEADIAAHHFIAGALQKLAPECPVICEEGVHHSVARHRRFWLVDPLDGTKSFVRGSGDFTVNIALINDGAPVLGTIYAPLTKTAYTGQEGLGAWKRAGAATEKISARFPHPDGWEAVRSHSHASPRIDDYLKRYTLRGNYSASSSIKFCVLAEGKADIYPRFGRTMEWDTAAGHAILRAAGGSVETEDGTPLTYGKPGFENPDFIAFGKR